MANEENLKPFKKGEVTNPAGRPVGSKNRSTIARKWLSLEQKGTNPLTGENETLSQEDMITLALVKKARAGDVNAYKALMDSGFGSPTQVTETEFKINNFDIKDVLRFDNTK